MSLVYVSSMLAAAGVTADELLRPPRPRPGWVVVPSARETGPISRPCPTCKAAIGADCNRATLGRYRFHKARMEPT